MFEKRTQKAEYTLKKLSGVRYEKRFRQHQYPAFTLIDLLELAAQHCCHFISNAGTVSSQNTPQFYESEGGGALVRCVRISTEMYGDMRRRKRLVLLNQCNSGADTGALTVWIGKITPGKKIFFRNIKCRELQK